MKKQRISLVLLIFVSVAFSQTRTPLLMVEDTGSCYTSAVSTDALTYNKATEKIYVTNEQPPIGSHFSKTNFATASRQLADQITVRNIEALRSLITPNPTAVYMEGYYTEGSGGGWFYWDNTSVEPDNDGTVIKIYNEEIGRYKRSYSGVVYADWFGAHGIADATSRIQAAFDLQDSDKSNVVEFTAGNTYALGTVIVPSQTKIIGNGAKLKPLNNPAQIFLINAKNGNVREYRDIFISDFKVHGDAQNIVKIIGSNWGNITIEYINSITGTGNALVSADLMLGTNPSGLTLKHLNSYHSNGYKYGFYSVANSTRASLDGLIIEHINIWPTEEGYPVYINHNLSTNSKINNLYHGAGGGTGGGILHVFRMNRGEVGNLWSEASNGDIVALSGSYRDLEINKIVMQTNTATEKDLTYFINAHMFNVSVGKCILQDDNAAGYERNNTPPDGYTCFKFTVDDAEHISRDVRIDNIKGNFNETHLDIGSSSNIRYTGQYINQDVTTASTPTFSNLTLVDAASPSITFQENGIAAYKAKIYDDGKGTLSMDGMVNDGNAFFQVNPKPEDRTSKSVIQFFRDVNTTGDRYISILEGNNTGNEKIKLSINEDSYFNTGMGLAIGGESTTYDFEVKGRAAADEFYISDFLKLTPTAAPPRNPSAGIIWASTDTHLYYFNGTTWKQLD